VHIRPFDLDRHPLAQVFKCLSKRMHAVWSMVLGHARADQRLPQPLEHRICGSDLLIERERTNPVTFFRRPTHKDGSKLLGC